MKSTRSRRLSIVIHDLNAWGGMERLTLEVARRLSHRWAVDVWAYTLQDPERPGGWGDVRFHRVRPALARPEPLKLLYFYAASTLPLLAGRWRRAPAPLVHAAGACSLVSDVVQVHFVQAAWREKRTRLQDRIVLSPRAGSGKGLGDRMLNAYYDAVMGFNVAMERATFTRGKTYVPVSESVSAELRDHYGLTDRIRVVRPGVDPRQFHPAEGAERSERDALRREMGIAQEDVAVLLVGAYDRKGLATALKAVAALAPPERRRVKLVAVGGGSKPRYAEMAKDLGVGDRLVLASHTREVAHHYRAADLFVLPTLYEPFGMVILEAMASGLAPVVSRIAGAAELIEHGTSGLLLDDPSSPVELAAHLTRLVADPDARARIAARALAAASLRTWDRVALEYATVLEPLMEGRSD